MTEDIGLFEAIYTMRAISGTKAEWYLGEHLAESPVIIMVYAIPGTDHQGNPRPLSEGAAGRQVVPAVQNMLLACRGLGLGSNFTSAIGAYHGDDIKALLGVPDEAIFIVMLPIGYPQGKHGPKTRQPVEEVTFANRWGQPIQFDGGLVAGGGA
jgi:nitroreductase